MFRRYAIFFLLIWGIMLSGCSQEADISTEIYRVELAVDYHFDDGERLRIDVRFPKIISELPFAAELNKMAKADFPDMGEDLSQRWSTAEGYPYTWYQYDFAVSDIDGVCSLSILETISSVSDDIVPYEWVHSYYFDSNSGIILTKKEYFASLGINPDELIEAYIREFYPEEEVTINFDYLKFYFDQNGDIHFVLNEMAKLN